MDIENNLFRIVETNIVPFEDRNRVILHGELGHRVINRCICYLG